MVVHVAIGSPESAQAEGVAPPNDQSVEPSHLSFLIQPEPLSTGQPANFTAESSTLILRWAHRDVRMTRAIGVIPTEGVTQEVEPFLWYSADRRLLLIHRQFQLVHHGLHDRHCLSGVAAAANHKVVGKIDKMSPKPFIVAENFPEGYQLYTWDDFRWSASLDLVAGRVDRVMRKWVDEWRNVDDYKEREANLRWYKRAHGPDHLKRVIRSLDAVVGYWREADLLPDGLRITTDNQLDAPGPYLGVANGIIDLDSGQRLSDNAARNALVTRNTGVAYRANADLDGDDAADVVDQLTGHLLKSTADYVWRCLAFALRGDPHRAFYVLRGETQGGKTTLLNAIVGALGDIKNGGYSTAFNGKTFAQDRYPNPNSHDSGLDGMHDARVVVMNEFLSRGILDTEKLKAVTGGSPFPIRVPHGRHAVVRSARGTIFAALNPYAQDVVNLSDDAVADRVRLIQWASVPESARNPALLTRVLTDDEVRVRVLARLVRYAGKSRYGEAPPNPPASVVADTQDHQRASLGRAMVWLKAHIVITGSESDFLPNQTMLRSLREAEPPDEPSYVENGPTWDGLTWQQLLKQLPQQILGLGSPSRKRLPGHTGSQRGYVGARLLTDAEVADEATVKASIVKEAEVDLAEPEVVTSPSSVDDGILQTTDDMFLILDGKLTKLSETESITEERLVTGTDGVRVRETTYRLVPKPGCGRPIRGRWVHKQTIPGEHSLFIDESTDGKTTLRLVPPRGHSVRENPAQSETPAPPATARWVVSLKPKQQVPQVKPSPWVKIGTSQQPRLWLVDSQI